MLLKLGQNDQSAKLLSHFKSWTKIKDASVEELASVAGKSAAEKITSFVAKKSEPENE
jgi:excinuclease UvrABC nuclease subunit